MEFIFSWFTICSAFSPFTLPTFLIPLAMPSRRTLAIFFGLVSAPLLWMAVEGQIELATNIGNPFAYGGLLLAQMVTISTTLGLLVRAIALRFYTLIPFILVGAAVVLFLPSDLVPKMQTWGWAPYPDWRGG